jgi:hypothetical protein
MNTQATHTPGPWEIGSINKRDKNLWWSAVFTPKSTGKFHTPRAGEALGVDREECEANARLIAAAPDLLEALRGLLRETKAKNPSPKVGKDFSLLVHIEGARKAIAKAEGAQ